MGNDRTCVIVLFVPVYASGLLLMLLLMVATEELVKDVELCRHKR